MVDSIYIAPVREQLQLKALPEAELVPQFRFTHPPPKFEIDFDMDGRDGANHLFEGYVREARSAFVAELDRFVGVLLESDAKYRPLHSSYRDEATLKRQSRRLYLRTRRLAYGQIGQQEEPTSSASTVRDSVLRWAAKLNVPLP